MYIPVPPTGNSFSFTNNLQPVPTITSQQSQSTIPLAISTRSQLAPQTMSLVKQLSPSQGQGQTQQQSQEDLNNQQMTRLLLGNTNANLNVLQVPPCPPSKQDDMLTSTCTWEQLPITQTLPEITSQSELQGTFTPFLHTLDAGSDDELAILEHRVIVTNSQPLYAPQTSFVETGTTDFDFGMALECGLQAYPENDLESLMHSLAPTLTSNLNGISQATDISQIQAGLAQTAYESVPQLSPVPWPLQEAKRSGSNMLTVMQPVPQYISNHVPLPQARVQQEEVKQPPSYSSFINMEPSLSSPNQLYLFQSNMQQPNQPFQIGNVVPSNTDQYYVHQRTEGEASKVQNAASQLVTIARQAGQRDESDYEGESDLEEQILGTSGPRKSSASSASGYRPPVAKRTRTRARNAISMSMLATNAKSSKIVPPKEDKELAIQTRSRRKTVASSPVPFVLPSIIPEHEEIEDTRSMAGSVMTQEDPEVLRIRNNESSKKSRAKRKQAEDDLEERLERLKDRNQQLKSRLAMGQALFNEMQESLVELVRGHRSPFEGCSKCGRVPDLRDAGTSMCTEEVLAGDISEQIFEQEMQLEHQSHSLKSDRNGM